MHLRSESREFKRPLARRAKSARCRELILQQKRGSIYFATPFGLTVAQPMRALPTVHQTDTAKAPSSLRLPDFLIIGAARTATTWLYECLREHPDVHVPRHKRPEPHFFLKSAEYRQGLAYYSNRYFDGVASSLVAGEASTSYLYQPYVAERIWQHIPEVKLIAIVRDPAERAFSNYVVTVRNGIEQLSFSEAIRTEPVRLACPCSTFQAEVAPFAYVDRGRYFTQLQPYLERFPRENILLLCHEDLRRDPETTLRSVFGFLGVDDAYVPNVRTAKPNSAAYNGDVLCSADREFIIQELQTEITNLSTLLGRNLEHWMSR